MSNDGTTAIQVSPTEDATMTANFLRKIAEAVVNASTMPDQIKDLQSQIEVLKTTLERAQTHSQELDNSLREMREQRDQARRERDEAESKCTFVVKDCERLTNERDSANRDVEHYKLRLGEIRKERDDAEYRALEANDKLDTANAKLKEIEDRVASVFGLHKPTPEPVKEAVSIPEPIVPPLAPEPYPDYHAPAQADPSSPPSWAALKPETQF